MEKACREIEIGWEKFRLEEICSERDDGGVWGRRYKEEGIRTTMKGFD